MTVVGYGCLAYTQCSALFSLIICTAFMTGDFVFDCHFIRGLWYWQKCSIIAFECTYARHRQKQVTMKKTMITVTLRLSMDEARQLYHGTYPYDVRGDDHRFFFLPLCSRSWRWSLTSPSLNSYYLISKE
jgi:hypothetical protein